MKPIKFNNNSKVPNEYLRPSKLRNDYHMRDELIKKLEEILNPEYQNTVFAWGQIEKAIKKLYNIDTTHLISVKSDNPFNAKEWMFIHYPEVIEQWGMTGHDDEYMCRMMEEYATMRIHETLDTLESMGYEELQSMSKKNYTKPDEDGAM